MQLFVNATLIDGNEYRSKYTVLCAVLEEQEVCLNLYLL